MRHTVPPHVGARPHTVSPCIRTMHHTVPPRLGTTRCAASPHGGTVSGSQSDLLLQHQMRMIPEQQTASTCRPLAPPRLGRDWCGGLCDDEAPATATLSRDGTPLIDYRAMDLREEKQAGRAAALWAALSLSLAAAVYAELSRGLLLSRRYGVATPGFVWYGELTLFAMLVLKALAHLWNWWTAGVRPAAPGTSRDGKTSLIDRAMKLRRDKQAERAAPLWAALNLLLAAAVCAELSAGLLSTSDLVRYGELTLVLVLVQNALTHLWTCVRPALTGPPTIAATAGQQVLLGLRNLAIRVTPPLLLIQSSATLGKQNVQSSIQSRPTTTSTSTSDPSNLSPSSIHESTSSVDTLGPPVLNSGVVPRYRRPASPSALSHRGNEEDYMENLEALDRFLHVEEEKDHRLRRLSCPGVPPETTFAASAFWNYSRPGGDQAAQGLRRFQYQPACRSTPAPASSAHAADASDPAGSQERLTTAEVWARVAGRPVPAHRISDWSANLRRWISDTILAPLAREVDEVNAQLRRTGTPEVQVGETTVDALRQAAAVGTALASSVPSLAAVARYMDVPGGADQEYVLERVRELAHGGSMGCFRWDGGSDGAKRGFRRWRAGLPTDAAIVAHAFCTYMDSRLPAHHRYPDGKTFTSQYFDHAPAAAAAGEAAGGKALPDVNDAAARRPLCIRQSAADPPRYQLLHQRQVYSLPEDRNNLFHTLLLFLYAAMVHTHGMLGRVSLGPAGVNILWIFTDWCTPAATGPAVVGLQSRMDPSNPVGLPVFNQGGDPRVLSGGPQPNS